MQRSIVGTGHQRAVPSDNIARMNITREGFRLFCLRLFCENFGACKISRSLVHDTANVKLGGWALCPAAFNRRSGGRRVEGRWNFIGASVNIQYRRADCSNMHYRFCLPRPQPSAITRPITSKRSNILGIPKRFHNLYHDIWIKCYIFPSCIF